MNTEFHTPFEWKCSCIYKTWMEGTCDISLQKSLLVSSSRWTKKVRNECDSLRIYTHTQNNTDPPPPPPEKKCNRTFSINNFQNYELIYKILSKQKRVNMFIGARIKVIHWTPFHTVLNQSRSSICGGFTLRALRNHAWYRHKGIRIRVLNVLVH